MSFPFQYNVSLSDLIKIILGKREEPLSPVEIKNIFSQTISPETHLHLLSALQGKKIDPHTMLVQSIANSKEKDDLIGVALALKFGADPNLYVSTPQIGDIHILAYSYIVLSDRDIRVLNSIIIMLFIMGSNPDQLVFNAPCEEIRDEYSLVEPVKGQTVLEWLDDQGYSTIIPQIIDDIDNIDDKFITFIGTLLDKNDIIKQKPDLQTMVQSLSVKVFDKYYQEYDSQEGLELSIKYLNIDAYEQFLKRGATINYGQINDIILQIGEYKQQKDYISMNQLRNMLLYSIKSGIILDLYQLELAEKTCETLFTKIITAYQQPYWIKISTNPEGKSDDKLKLLAYRLNLNPKWSKRKLSQQIKNITQADPDFVKRSVIARQITRIQSDVSYIYEFDNKCPFNIKCSNNTMSGIKTPYDYPDSDIVYYRDDNNKLWCFTSNNYLKMVSKKHNPYNNEPFPKKVIKDTLQKIKFISKYRSIDSEPQSISTTIDQLNQEDQIDNFYTDKYVNNFKNILNQYGLSYECINQLSLEEMENILKTKLNITTNLKKLDIIHGQITFVILVYHEIKNNTELQQKIIDSIKYSNVIPE